MWYLLLAMRITNAGHPAMLARPDSAPAARRAPVQALDTAGRVDRVNAVERALNPVAARLVAAVVPGSIDFAGPAPRPARAATPIYAHPADANAAATRHAVATVGARLDVTG